MNINQARQEGQKLLAQSPTPVLDTDCILESVLKKDKTYILFHRDDELTQEQQDSFFGGIKKRAKGLPVAYITGHKEFYGIDFFVTPDVLIPKPDTEVLVEEAAGIIRAQLKNGGTVRVCDMCTGSGCIGISVLKECLVPGLPAGTRLEFTLADISTAALDIAKKNALNILGKETFSKITFVRGDLFENISGRFNVILSNPPYIPKALVPLLLTDGRSEPSLALDGDAAEKSSDGLGIVRRLVPQAASHLASGGILLVETGEYNAQDAELVFKKEGFKDTRIIYDLSGMMRDVFGRI